MVDQAAPGAADTDPGTDENPFKTVQRAADAGKPGDTVYVMAIKNKASTRSVCGCFTGVISCLI